jgi:hypothetical protein
MANVLDIPARQFVREFSPMKDLARAGRQIRITTRYETCLFRALQTKGGFWGALKGTVKRQAEAEQLFSTGESWEAAQ